MVLSSNPGEGRNYFYSRARDGGLSVTHFEFYIIAIKSHSESINVTDKLASGKSWLLLHE